MAEAGGVSAAVRAMKRFPADARLQVDTFACLRYHVDNHVIGAESLDIATSSFGRIFGEQRYQIHNIC